MSPRRRAMGRLAAWVLLLSGSCTGVAAEPLSVVALGNSITRHGPAPAVRWTGDWGMAASSLQTDYVGQLARLLNERAQVQASAQRFNIAAMESKPGQARPGAEMLSAARASDLLVVELGDNVKASGLADFEPAYARLLAQSRPEKGLLVCLSTWWGSAATDALIEPACQRAGGVFVRIGDIHRQPGKTGARGQGLSDPGVLSHPGDAGMADIAARIFDAWQSRGGKRAAP